LIFVSPDSNHVIKRELAHFDLSSLFQSNIDVIGACEHLPSDTLLDGEIIALDNTGRISFNMLQPTVYKLRRSSFIFMPSG
jgi:ATP-dependent DNA ligase